jgi:hypothetical protein
MFFQVCQRINQGDWFVEHVPSEGTYITKDKYWASFNDVIDIEEKATWITKEGLGGAGVFLIAGDDSKGACGCEPFPLLKKINEIFFKKNISMKKCVSSAMKKIAVSNKKLPLTL